MDITIYLNSAGDDEFAVMAALREFFDLSFGEARDLISGAPSALPPVDSARVDALVSALEAAGASVSLDSEAAEQTDISVPGPVETYIAPSLAEQYGNPEVKPRVRHFLLEITGVRGADTARAVRLLTDGTGCSRREAQQMMEQVPSQVEWDALPDEAEALADELSEAGISVRLRRKLKYTFADNMVRLSIASCERYALEGAGILLADIADIPIDKAFDILIDAPSWVDFQCEDEDQAQKYVDMFKDEGVNADYIYLAPLDEQDDVDPAEAEYEIQIMKVEDPQAAISILDGNLQDEDAETLAELLEDLPATVDTNTMTPDEAAELGNSLYMAGCDVLVVPYDQDEDEDEDEDEDDGDDEEEGEGETAEEEEYNEEDYDEEFQPGEIPSLPAAYRILVLDEGDDSEESRHIVNTLTTRPFMQIEDDFRSLPFEILTDGRDDDLAITRIHSLMDFGIPLVTNYAPAAEPVRIIIRKEGPDRGALIRAIADATGVEPFIARNFIGNLPGAIDLDKGSASQIEAICENFRATGADIIIS